MWQSANAILNQAAQRIISKLANFVPGLLAFLAVVLFAVLVAWIVRLMLARSLRGVQFDQRVGQWGFASLAEWFPSKSPSLIIARLVFWTIILVGFLVGISALNADLTSLLVMRLFAYLPNVFAALLILIVGIILARFLARSVLISAVNMQIHSARLLSLGVKWLVLVLTAAMALEHLGIGGEIVRLSFAILFGGIVLAMALAVGLGSKDMVSRTWERQGDKSEDKAEEQQLHHL